jgi:hypothetical protein
MGGRSASPIYQPTPGIDRTVWEWSCGHSAASICAECYRELAAEAHRLAEENLALRDRVAELEILKRWRDTPR